MKIINNKIKNTPKNMKRKPEFKKLLNKGISTPVGIIIILTVAVVVGVGAWYLGKRQAPEPYSDNYFSIVQKDETADWKVYRNQERGYEIKYPEEALLDKNPSESLDGRVKIHFLKNCYLGLDGGPFGIEDPDIKVESWEDSVVVDKEEHKRHFSRFPNGEIPDFAFINLDYSQDENYPHFLIYHSIKDECLPLINQMLSTFKFTN